MRSFLFAILLCASVAFGQVLTTEVLVSNASATSMPRDSNSRGFEIYNHGPNNIWCAINTSSAAVVGKSRKIAPESTWSAAVQGAVGVWCIAETAAQVTGAATVIVESR